MQFQFRAGDKEASSYVPPSPSTPQFSAQSSIGNLRSAAEYMRQESSVQEELLAAQAIMRRGIEAELSTELIIQRELAIIRSDVGFFYFDQPNRTLIRLKEYEILAFMCGSGDGVHGNSKVTKPLSVCDRMQPTGTAKPLCWHQAPNYAKKIEVAGGNQLHPPSKKRKTENKWTCPLCQVSATCEQDLQDHFQGMTHKAKEASLRKSEEMNQKICSPDPSPNDDEGKPPVKENQKDKKFWCPICEISTTSQALMKMHWSGKKHMARLKKKSGALMTDDAQDIGETTAAEEDDSLINAERTEETGAREDMSKDQDKLLLKKRQRNPTFWCETCKIGTTSKDLMKEHQGGKKHKAKLRKICETLMAMSCLPVDAQNVGETTAMEEDTSPSNPGRTEEIEAEDYTHKGDKLLLNERQTNGKFWCQTCKIGTTGEDSMKEHQNGKKHKAKLRQTSRILMGVSCLPDEAQNVGETTATEEDASSSDGERTEEMEAQDDMTEEQDKLLLKQKQTNLKFWCETCKFGTTSEGSMKEHRNGKEHMALLMKYGGGLITISTLPDTVQNGGQT